MRLRVSTAAGHVVDEITVKSSTGASLTCPSISCRRSGDAENLADYVAEYIAIRASRKSSYDPRTLRRRIRGHWQKRRSAAAGPQSRAHRSPNRAVCDPSVRLASWASVSIRRG